MLQYLCLPRSRNIRLVRGPEGVTISAESASVIRGISVISESECPWDVIVNFVVQKHYERALAEPEMSLGVDHPNTLTAVHNMA